MEARKLNKYTFTYHLSTVLSPRIINSGDMSVVYIKIYLANTNKTCGCSKMCDTAKTLSLYFESTIKGDSGVTTSSEALTAE